MLSPPNRSYALRPDIPRLVPVKAVQVCPFKPKKFITGQSDGHRVFMVADEFERGVVIVMDGFVHESFIRKAHRDVVAVLAPTNIHLVRRHAIEVCERALDRLAVDVGRVHFQFDSKKRLGFVPCGGA